MRRSARHLGRLVLGVAIQAMLFSAAVTHAAELTGITFTYNEPPNPSYLYTINQSTGLTSNQRSTGIVRMVGLARVPGNPDKAYAINAFNGAHNLYQLSVTTGTSLLIGDTGLGLTEGDLAFAKDGTLYALSFGNALCRINTTTGAATNGAQITGSPNSQGGQQSDFSAMAFDAADNLWVLDVSWTPDILPTYLLKVDRNTGTVLTFVAVSQHLGTTCGMSFEPATGQLWVGDGTQNGSNTVYRLNTTTGALAVVGSPGLPSFDGLSGLSFYATTCVECPIGGPVTLGVLFVLLAVLGAWQVNRRFLREGA